MADRGGIPLPEPLAYFLTWPTYGTWLPGDERGWVKYRRGFQLPDPVKELEAAARMSDDACRLNAEERGIVEATVAGHCRIRNWTLHAVNCRSNHLHVVVTASEHPDKVREQLKAWCTRRLKEFQCRRIPSGLRETALVRTRWWDARGSKRYINDVDSLEAAILYVREAQDSPR
jgi:REP element-mobilizing transposase RayT